AFWLFGGNVVMLAHVRKIIPFAVIELASTGFWPVPAPLLEKERHFPVPTLVPNRSYPLGAHRPRTRAAFAADDHPIAAGKIECADGANQRLYGKKSHTCWRVLKMPDARYFGPVLDGDAEPYMHWAPACAVALPKEAAHEGRALCKYLERVPRRALHRIE